MSHQKQIFKFSILKKFLNDAESCVSLVSNTRLLALPPFFLNDMKCGIFYLLDNILKKYDRSLDGIVIGYQNVKILMDENTGIIPIGSAETEVNVSVEFYIFQPKIGSTLKGVVNKKSKTHIGCLVHEYFNATILKPEDVDYEDWNCKDFNVNDKILFTVKDLDFTGVLPHIEGTLYKESILQRDKAKRKGKRQNQQKKSFLGNNLRSSVDEFLHEESSKAKKKKKKSKQKSHKDDELQGQSLVSNAKKLISNDTSIKSKDDEGDNQKKTKKKKKMKRNSAKESVSDSSKMEEGPNEVTHSLPQKFLSTNDDDYDEDDYYFANLSSKKGKKKKEEEEAYNKVSEGQQKQDELFYSTQLEPNLGSKMNTSCSPILKRTSTAFNDKPKTPFNKEKKKDGKRKAEDSTDGSAAKKHKKHHRQVNGTEDTALELLQLQELNRVKDEMKISETKEIAKKESTFLYEKLLKDAKHEITLEVNKEPESDSSLKKKKKKKHRERKVESGSITPEKATVVRNLFSDSEKSHQNRSKKKNMNGVSATNKILDPVPKEKKKKDDSRGENSKFEATEKETKQKCPRKKKGDSRESLREKLLRDAREMLGMGEDSSKDLQKMK